MNKEDNFLLSIIDDIDIFKTPLLTRKQYAVSILKLSLLVALLLILFLLFLNLESVVIILSSIIFIPFLSFMLFYFNILFIKRYLDTSMPLFLLFFIPILYTLSCSFGMLYEFFMWESPIKWFFRAGIWLLPALLLFILSFVMPSSHKERPIITKIKNSLYIKKNILYPINNILTLKFKNRINSKQFIYGLLFTFIALLLFLLHKDIIELLENVYTQILHFQILFIKVSHIEKYQKMILYPMFPLFINYGNVFFVFISFLVLFINSYKNASKNKPLIFIISLILILILPYSIHMFFGAMITDYANIFKPGYGDDSIIFYSSSETARYLLLISFIFLFIYYKLISKKYKNKIKVIQINKISYTEYIVKVIALIFMYILIKDIVEYLRHILPSVLFLPSGSLNPPSFIHIFLELSLVYYILYYTIKQINNAIINKLLFIPFIVIYICATYEYNNLTPYYIYYLLSIILLIIAAAFIPKYISERKYIFNNEKYKKLADFFNISNKIENILFFKLKKEITIREFILSFIFVFVMYIFIIPVHDLIYMITNMSIYMQEEIVSENRFVTIYTIPKILYMYIILVVYSIFVLICNGIYTIYMKRKGVING